MELIFFLWKFFFFFFLNAWPVEDFLHSSLWHFFKERFIIKPLRTQMKDVYYPACQHLVFVLVHDNFEVVQIQWNNETVSNHQLKTFKQVKL